MLENITLRGYRSFGEEVTVPLSPITVIVGANNSGKSNFLRFPGLVRRVLWTPLSAGVAEIGDFADFFHRPSSPNAGFSWKARHGSYSAALERHGSGLRCLAETLVEGSGLEPFSSNSPLEIPPLQVIVFPGWAEFRGPGPLQGARTLLQGLNDLPEQMKPLREAVERARRVLQPIVDSQFVKLQLPSLRADSEVVPAPSLGEDGSGLASVLALWRGSDSDRSDLLTSLLRSCLPEVRDIQVKPAPTKGLQRLWVRQSDGESFDSTTLSDGLLCFVGLAMHALSAPEGALMLVEEPEQSIHPRRLHQYVDFVRLIARERKCQFVLSTHSPVLLNEFRDEPESILLFRRGQHGTRVQRLSEEKDLMESLSRQDAGDPGDGRSTPGLMLQDGFFTDVGA